MAKRKDRTPPPIGASFIRKYKKKAHAMKVVANGDAVGYLVRGTVFKTPTAAAKAITKTEVNGWVFWGIE
jgi:hypothetical protein